MLSNHVARIFSTLIIWAAITVLGAATMVNSVFLGGGPVILVMAMLLGAAVTATQFVWKNSEASSSDEAEKAKRRGKVERVLNNLSDEEVEELRQRLGEPSDGEVVSLDELIAMRERRS